MTDLELWAGHLVGYEPLLAPTVVSKHNPPSDVLGKIRAALKVGEDIRSFGYSEEEVQSSLGFLEDEKTQLAPLMEGKTLVLGPDSRPLALLGPEHYYVPTERHREINGQIVKIQGEGIPEIHPEIQAFLTCYIGEKARLSRIEATLIELNGGKPVVGNPRYALTFPESRNTVIRHFEAQLQGLTEKPLFSGNLLRWNPSLTPTITRPIFVDWSFYVPDGLTGNPRFEFSNYFAYSAPYLVASHLYEDLYSMVQGSVRYTRETAGVFMVPEGVTADTDIKKTVWVGSLGRDVLCLPPGVEYRIKSYEVRHRERNFKWQVRLRVDIDLYLPEPVGVLQ